MSGNDWKGLRVGVAAARGQWENLKQPFKAVVSGLERLGCEVQIRRLKTWPIFDDPQLVILWNGRWPIYRRVIVGCQAAKVPYLIMERGFFDRWEYTQIDHVGILHWASWARSLTQPAPPGGSERLHRVWPGELGEFGPRRGYVLVLGQVPRDSQLDESEIRRPEDLAKAVANALPSGNAVFRPHPRRHRRSRDVARRLPICPAGTLEESVREAAFAVTINSNAGNECLAMGCPVLAFGPALYTIAGVARRTSLATLRQDMQEMLAGWRPNGQEVANYLAWLAARQWNDQELAEGSVLSRLIQDALRREPLPADTQ